MRKIVSYLRQFWKEDFHWGTYGTTLAFLAMCLLVNYHYDFTDRHIYHQPDGVAKWLRWLGLMVVPYVVVLGLQAVFQRPVEALKRPAFWTMLLFAMLMVTTTAWFPWHKTLARLWFPKELYRWGVLILWNLKRFVFMLLPLLVFWLAVDRRRSQFYGLFTKPKGLGVYFGMLLIVLPLIVVASFQPDFLKAYPQYEAGPAEARHGISPWITGGVFELVYGADFAMVELVFRGFLVIGFTRWLGPKAVLPMAATYCCLHFGKPAGEAVASIFGGYILGVIVYYSKSIWGGIVVHLGLAWMMEAAAYLQKLR